VWFSISRGSLANACNAYGTAGSCDAATSCDYDYEDNECYIGSTAYAMLVAEYCPTEELSESEYVERFNVCPFYKADFKCALYVSRMMCEADDDCEYDRDLTDPYFNKYPCGAKTSFLTDLSVHHVAEVFILLANCRTYQAMSSCNADDKCDWDEDGERCDISDERGVQCISEPSTRAAFIRHL
jgi:hypothetical protein